MSFNMHLDYNVWSIFMLSIIKYYKQTQLEAMSSEKTAAEFQLEKEMKRVQEVQVWLQLFTLLLHITVSGLVVSLYTYWLLIWIHLYINR